jgi:ribosomal protein S18 acetylase RimI-like enzyme
MRLRPASEEDLDLAFEITVEAMRGYVEQTWGVWNDKEQRRKHAESFNPATHRVVMMEDLAAGLLATETLVPHVWLVKLYLRSAFRGRGIGSQVLQDVIAEASTLAKPVWLRVLRVNTKAQAFYARHGFQVVGEELERLFMRRASEA